MASAAPPFSRAYPGVLAFDGGGALVFGEDAGLLRKLDLSTSTVTTLIDLSTSVHPSGLAVDALTGTIYVVDENGWQLLSIDNTSLAVTIMAGTGNTNQYSGPPLYSDGTGTETRLTTRSPAPWGRRARSGSLIGAIL